jgi:hypothetical protein
LTFYELKDRVSQLIAAGTEDNTEVVLRVVVEHQPNDLPAGDLEDSPDTIERPVASIELERKTRQEVVIS